MELMPQGPLPETEKTIIRFFEKVENPDGKQRRIKKVQNGTVVYDKTASETEFQTFFKEVKENYNGDDGALSEMSGSVHNVESDAYSTILTSSVTTQLDALLPHFISSNRVLQFNYNPANPNWQTEISAFKAHYISKGIPEARLITGTPTSTSSVVQIRYQSTTSPDGEVVTTTTMVAVNNGSNPNAHLASYTPGQNVSVTAGDGTLIQDENGGTSALENGTKIPPNEADIDDRTETTKDNFAVKYRELINQEPKIDLTKFIPKSKLSFKTPDGENS